MFMQIYYYLLKWLRRGSGLSGINHTECTVLIILEDANQREMVRLFFTFRN